VTSAVAQDLGSFPTTCDCEGARPECEGPDLTPRTALLLAIAGRRLAEDVRAAIATSRVPVPMYYLARALDNLAESLDYGRRPAPRTQADALCLHVMIACATDLAFEVGDALGGDLPRSEFDYDYERLYDTLLPGDEHENVIWAVQQSPRGGGCFDFATLCEVVPDDTLHGLFHRPAR
jgi:hypothetical protein